MSLELPTVSLTMMATKDHAAAAHAFKKTSERARFHNRIVFTDQPQWFPDDVEHVYLPPFEEYKKICVWGLTEAPALMLARMAQHALCIQWDGFVINPDAWTDEFLNYDMIGAPMFGNCVGNHGFMLVSRKFYEAVQALKFEPTEEACHPSDHMLSLYHRSRMEAQGVKFAPVPLARQFSVENEPPYTGTFGGHGKLFIADIVRQGLYL